MGLMGGERQEMLVELCVEWFQRGGVGEKMRDVIPEKRDVVQGEEGRFLRSEYCQTPGERFHVRCLSGYVEAILSGGSKVNSKIRSEWMANTDCLKKKKKVDAALSLCNHRSLKGHLKAWDCT